MGNKLFKVVVLLFMFLSFLAPNVGATGNNSNEEEVPIEENSQEIEVLNTQDDIFLEKKGKQIENLMSKLKDKKKVRVILELNTQFQPEGKLKKEEKSEQRAQIAAIQNSVKEDLQSKLPEQAKSIKVFKTVPFIVVEVDANGLDALHKNPNVKSILEDIPMPVGLPAEKPSTNESSKKEKGNSIDPPSLVDSTNVIKANVAWSQGFTGEGQTVAILDTGVDKNHTFLANKVVSEACYSTNSQATDGGQSLCPGGVTESTAINSGLDCTNVNGCGHGTHVAGIAAGKGSSFSGVAKDAKVIAMQVFTKFNSTSICVNGAPCALSYTSDQISALERVYALSSQYSIASINMSLGGGRFYSVCEDPRQGIIDNLKSIGIATVIASGNNGYKDSIGAPGCISTAVTVGATDNSDIVTDFSNSAAMVDLLAPGYEINSASNGGGFERMSGTSMATPHVAGAWAVVKEKFPNASVEDIEQKLKSGGVSVTDTNGLTKPRIDFQWIIDTKNFVDLYSQNFEATNGQYTKSGTNNSWEWGIPTDILDSSTKVWGTNLDGNYNVNEVSYVESPVINLSGVKSVLLVSWRQWLNTETGWDFSSVEVSKDGGLTWAVIDSGTGHKAAWENKSAILDASYAVNNFKIRFGLNSDFLITYPGIYIDDIKIRGEKEIPLKINSVTANVQGTSTTGKPITWTVNAEGSGVQYAYYVYKGTTRVETIGYSGNKTLTWTPKEVGDYYVKAYAKDSGGKTVSKNSAVIKVSAAALKINSVTANVQGTSTTGKPITWTVNAEGKGLQYAYYVYKGTTKVATIWYTSNNKLTWTPKEAGDYYVKVYAKDSGGKTVSKNSAVIKVSVALKINSVTANVQGTSTTGKPITWTVNAEGTGLQYAYYVYKGTTKVATIWYTSNNKLTWTPKVAGDYYVKVYAKDSGGKTVSKNSAVIKVQ
ncbi:S8 family serine peptidase [Neobacillus niacini]|uniref:S8 family serine peptidase n=1 Tax=Neobacillus niacini TaxID=86668 RepID=UPI001C8E35A5|nr:S8 family serine peptidase [Neobacillus niacini]MBY0145086.1 S8 family serine peptidase [Neobacillus niacini]